MCGLVNDVGGRNKSVKLTGEREWIVMNLNREKVLTNSLFFWFLI